MKKIKSREEVFSLNEAADWPVGSIAKVSTKLNLGKYNFSWSTYVPEQATGASDGMFYMRVESSGRKWIEGPIIFGNCLLNASFKKVRVDRNSLGKPGPEYTYFVKDKVQEANIIGKPFFIDGKEEGLLDMEGKPFSPPEGEYVVKGLNFKLSEMMKTTVVYLRSRSDKKFFNVKVSDLETFSKELSQNQKEVIAEWFANELGGAEIEVTQRDDEFQISQWYVKAAYTDGYPSNFSAGPFVNEKQAKDVLESIKKINKYSLFDPEKAKIETAWSKTNLTLDGLIDWAKTVGVKTTMKELLNLRKGAVTAKDFGI